MAVSATVTYGLKLDDVSVIDEVTGAFCEDADGPLQHRSFNAGDKSTFTCERDENDQYAGKVNITGSKGNTDYQADYRLEQISNELEFPKPMPVVLNQIRKYLNFEDFAKAVVSAGSVNKS